MQSYFSNGKLLITGEYVVLDGALSLAIPTKHGQRMEVEFRDSEEADNTLTWYSIDSDGETWYREEFLIEEGSLGEASTPLSPQETTEDNTPTSFFKMNAVYK